MLEHPEATVHRKDASVNTTQYTTIKPTDRYQRSYANGQQKFFDGLSATYCANGAEYDGFMAAANQIAQEHEQGVWDAELEALRARDLEVDEAQSGYADWRWA